MKNHPNNMSAPIWLITTVAILLLTGATNMPDPTRPPEQLIPASKKLHQTGTMQVTAIFIYPSRRFAIISGHMASVGDKIGEYTVINIQHDTVELKGSQDTSMILQLVPMVKKAR